MILSIVGGGLLAYGLVVKEKGEREMNESMPWYLIVGLGLIFIITGIYG